MLRVDERERAPLGGGNDHGIAPPNFREGMELLIVKLRTYNVRFSRVANKAMTVIAEIDGVLYYQLQGVFEEHTGLSLEFCRAHPE
jgi:hypothetical protein